MTLAFLHSFSLLFVALSSSTQWLSFPMVDNNDSIKTLKPNSPKTLNSLSIPLQALAALLCHAPAKLARHIMAVMHSMVEVPQTLNSNPGLGGDNDPISRRDLRLCSALLRNPSFINPWMSFIFLDVMVHPEKKLNSPAFIALDFFFLLLGKDFKCIPEFPTGRCARKLKMYMSKHVGVVKYGVDCFLVGGSLQPSQMLGLLI